LNAPVSAEKVQDIAKACTFDAMKKEMIQKKGPDGQINAKIMRKGKMSCVLYSASAYTITSTDLKLN